MSAQLRICPHCGAGVIGTTTICPRCEQPLDQAVSPEVATNVQVRPSAEPEPPSEPAAMVVTDEEEVAHTRPQERLEPPPSESTEPPVQPPMTLPSLENAYTAPVPMQMIGASKAPTPAAPVSAIVPAQPTIPPAPYTPPPVNYATAAVPYSYPSNYYLQQRVDAYRMGGYDLLSFSPYQAVLDHGKPLGLIWWLVAMLSGIGLLWYFLILLSSGFARDRVYLVIEREGALYEDGAGAAHTRRKRARVGQRWGFTGVVIFFISLLWFVGMVVGGVYALSEYQPELEAAYPTITMFATGENIETRPALEPETVEMMESGVIAYSVLFTLSVIGVLCGLTLILIGYLHSAAYHVRVPPLADYF